MCRNIKTLFNFEPPGTREEVRAASLQFVRKISGFTTPSKANEAAFARAIDDISASAEKLLHSLEFPGQLIQLGLEVFGPGHCLVVLLLRHFPTSVGIHQPFLKLFLFEYERTNGLFLL